MNSRITKKRLRANRQNAQKSTGPKTEQGKQAVRLNALKHGLLSRQTVIDSGDGKENLEQYQQLLNDTVADLYPQGVREEMLVQTIVNGWWRLRRVLRAEVGEIRCQLDNIVAETEKKRELEIYMLQDMAVTTDCHLELRQISAGAEYLVTILEDTREYVLENGDLPMNIITRLKNNFGDEESSIATIVEDAAESLQQEQKRFAHNHVDTKDLPLDSCPAKKAILEAFDKEAESLCELFTVLKQREDDQLEAEKARLSLPSDSATKKILRYETAINRQLTRALADLDRLQSARLSRPLATKQTHSPATPCPSTTNPDPLPQSSPVPTLHSSRVPHPSGGFLRIPPRVAMPGAPQLAAASVAITKQTHSLATPSPSTTNPDSSCFSPLITHNS